MNGGQALARALVHEGVTVVFGVPGGGQYEAVDGLYGEPSITYISTRHEQAASFMADGYARASGHLAAVLVVPGPGLCNAAAGMLTAGAASSPMLVITGPRHVIGNEEAGSDLVRSLTKWVARPRDPGQIAVKVNEAVARARSGRPQPVALEITQDVLASTATVERHDSDLSAPPRAADESSVAEAARLLENAERPVIYAGSGVHRADATALVQKLAEQLQAPVLTTRGGKGAISDRHPLSLGFAELRYQPLASWLESRDVILVVGARHQVERISSEQAQLIRIDADASAMGSGEAVGIAGDACEALEAITCKLQAHGGPGVDRAEDVHAQVQTLNQARFDPDRQLQPQWGLMQAIRMAIPDDGILVQGMNQLGYYSRNYYPVYAPRSYITSSAQITLGCAYPLALGAKLAQPGRAVVSLSGDGGFLYNSQEMATAIQYGINAIAIVFNDNAYGNVLRAQIEDFDDHIIGTRLHNPDLVAMAESFGVPASRAEEAEELGSALADAIDRDEPALIEVPVGMMEREF